jgi:hypothetical protein
MLANLDPFASFTTEQSIPVSTQHQARPLLLDYFTRYAQDALATIKDSLLAKGYYERILKRLASGDTLREEETQIAKLVAKLGISNTIKVVEQAINQLETQKQDAWALPKTLEQLGKHVVTIYPQRLEHLPRYTVNFMYPSLSTKVNVLIETVGENIKIDIDAGKNSMKAQLALADLEQQLTWTTLSAE